MTFAFVLSHCCCDALKLIDATTSCIHTLVKYPNWERISLFIVFCIFHYFEASLKSLRLSLLFFSVAKGILHSQMSICLFICSPVCLQNPQQLEIIILHSSFLILQWSFISRLLSFSACCVCTRCPKKELI